MPQRSVATNYTFEQQRSEINLLAADFWSQKATVDGASTTYLKHDGTNDFTGGTLAVPAAFTINSNSGAGTVTISGNLNVTGTTTTVNTTNLDVTDKNITIAKGNTSDATADGAGITIDSGTDITWNFVDAKDAWVSSIGIEADTFLKAPYGQFTAATTPTTGQGVEVNAPDANTGQISSYDRDNSAYKDLRIKGTGIDFYAGSTNAVVGGFHNTGLIMESGKSIACGTVVSTISSPDPYNTVNTNLTLVNGAGNQGAGSKIDFTCGNGKAHIQTLVTGGNSDSGLALVFATSPDNAGADERLRITSDGAIGIGNLQSNQTTVTHSSSTKLYIDSTKFTKIARLGSGSIGSAAWYTVAKISSGQGNHFKCYVSIGGNFTQDMCVMELTGSWSASGGLSNTYTEPVFTAHRTGAHSTDRITKARFAKDSSNATFFQIYIAGGVDSNTFGKSVLEYQIGTYSQNTADSGSEAMFAAVGTPLIEIRTLEFTDNALCTNAGSHRIYTGGSERLRINPTGDVILGFEGNSLYFNNGFNDSNARIQNSGSSNNSNLRFLTRNAGTEVERFQIANDGKIYVGGSGASATAGELWFNDTSAYSSKIAQIAGSSALSFHTGQSQPERLRISSDGTISKYHNATDVSAAFGGSGQVNGVTALPSMAGTPFVVAKDTGTLRSAIFAGNVGINESSPDNKLHITTTSSLAYDTNTNNTQNNTNALLKLENLDGGDGTGVNNYVGIQFSVANGANSTAQLNYVRSGDNAGAFKFKARNASSTYPNLMTIKSDGKVGIGIGDNSDITGTLEVADTGDYQLILKDTNNAGQGAEMAMGFKDSSNTIQGWVGLNQWENDDLHIGNANSGGQITFKTHNGTGIGERLRITSGGQLVQTTTHTAGNSAHVNTGWYGDDANHYDLEYTDFNEIKMKKTESTSGYLSLVYKRETMSQYCDMEFTINGSDPQGYRHFAISINGDGSDTTANFDRFVYRANSTNSSLNQVRLDKGGGGSGFNYVSSSVTNIFDENDHHVHIQIRKRQFTISVDGNLIHDTIIDGDLNRSSGYPAFCIYEGGGGIDTWVKIRDFKIRNYSANAKSNSMFAGGNKFIQLSRPSGNTEEIFTAQQMGMDDNEVALMHLVVSGPNLQDWGYSFFHWRMRRGSPSEIQTQITPMASGSSVATFTQAASTNSLVINKDSDLEVHLTIIGGGGRRTQVGW